MKKTILVQLTVDDFELVNLDKLLAALEELVEDYPDKRLTVNLQDEPMIRPRPIR